MLKEIIDKFYTDRKKDRTQHHFYITDAGRCPRAIFFKFKNAPQKEIEPHFLRLFDHGDHMHQLIMKSLFSTRDIHVVGAEITISPQELISGRADAIISDGKELYVLDIKSMNSMVFRTLTEPKEENVNQIQLYLHYFEIKKGILLYVNKDSLELKEFIVDYDKTKAKTLLDGLSNLKSKIEADVVPSRIDEYPTHWQCRYCSFREICDIGEGGEMGWEELKAKITSQ